MSKYYDEDDMYDYDDYDEQYEEQYDQSSYGGNSYDIVAETAVTSRGPTEPPSDYVQFVMEALGTVEVTAAGTRVVGVISEARILQMLEAFSFDSDATISHFLTQRETSKVTTTKKVEVKKVETKAAPKGTGPMGTEKKLTQGELKKRAKEAAELAKAPAVSSVDVSAMGFEIKDKGMVPARAAAPAPAPSSSLITSSAPLSDEEYEPSSSGKGKKGDDIMPHITMVVAGHVDAGKSTLVGNLLYKAGNVAQRTMHKYEKESQQTGKGSFALAWVMDESQSEREHGVTIEVAEKQLKTENRSFTILDAPGHRDFIPNMISGATQADVALLVIPAGRGEYETSMSDGAQTREHAVLLRALGVGEIVVAVNKMETLSPPWSQDRFLQIEGELRDLLEELQFPPRAIRFVPLSGLTGENMVALSPACALNQWYSGPTLLQALDSFGEPARRTEAPLRAVVTAVVSENSKGCEVQVTVLQGRLRAGRGVGLASAAGAATVKKMVDVFGLPATVLLAGEKGTVTLVDRSNRSGEEMYLRDGMVLCKGPSLPARCLRFKATVLTMAGLQPPLIPGSTYELYLHGEVVQCCVTRLYSINSTAEWGRGKGKGSKKGGVQSIGGGYGSSGVDRQVSPKCVPGGRCAKVKIEVTQSVCIEPFKICEALGRFALRTKGKTCAVGICEKVKKIE